MNDGDDVGAVLRSAARRLQEAGVASPEHDARALLSHALGVDRPDPAATVPRAVRTVLDGLVERRRSRVPLQHIVGSAGFRYLDLIVRPGVFVPRPETELVAQEAIDEAVRIGASGRRPLVVDLCCGAGGIAIAVATEVQGSDVVAVDVDHEAVELTAANAVANGARVRVERGDVTDPDLLPELVGRVDVVVANPPYIPPGAVPVDPEVRDHDPPAALYGGGSDGLAVPRSVVDHAVRLLRPGGLLVMEHADEQGAQVRTIVTGAGFADARTLPDLLGRDRMVLARRPARTGVAP